MLDYRDLQNEQTMLNKFLGCFSTHCKELMMACLLGISTGKELNQTGAIGTQSACTCSLCM